MSSPLLWFVPVIVAASATILTIGLRHYALAHGVLDIPNERSSHSTPTPRGGGMAIVVTFLATVAGFGIFHVVEREVGAALFGAGVLVALIGFLDDHRHVAAHWRLLTHLTAAAWVLVWLGGVPPVTAAGEPVSAGWLGNAVAALYLMWLLNLYNFMDGIDGIAGLEAVTVGLGVSVIYLMHPSTGEEWLLPASLAMAAMGFLVWNWPPARIFMGDAGSGFVGLMLGAMSLRAASLRPELFWSWLVLLGVFIVDATGTLLRRLVRGERPFQAHRDHAYQCATRCIGSHRPVTLAIGAINVFWLLPLAFLVSRGRLNGPVAVMIAYTPLACLGVRYSCLSAASTSSEAASGTLGGAAISTLREAAARSAMQDSQRG